MDISFYIFLIQLFNNATNDKLVCNNHLHLYSSLINLLIFRLSGKLYRSHLKLQYNCWSTALLYSVHVRVLFKTALAGLNIELKRIEIFSIKILKILYNPF